MVIKRIKPKSGFSHFAHLGLMALLPALMYVLVRIEFAPLAASLVVLSKWRMFAVRPRYWPANLRANAVDMIVGFATVIFMSSTGAASWQLVWAFVYMMWLILIKPGSSIGKTSLQAFIAQTMGLMAIFTALGSASIPTLVVAVWLVCYSVARHFFTAFEEPYTALYAHAWGYFAASITWLLSHWLIYYGIVAQPTLLLTVLAFALSALYFLQQTDRLSVAVRRNLVTMMIAIVTVVILLTDWSSGTV